MITIDSKHCGLVIETRLAHEPFSGEEKPDRYWLKVSNLQDPPRAGKSVLILEVGPDIKYQIEEFLKMLNDQNCKANTPFRHPPDDGDYPCSERGQTSVQQRETPPPVMVNTSTPLNRS